MENTDEKELLKSELAKMSKAATTFCKNLIDIEDSLLLIGCIAEGDNTHAEIILGGASENMVKAINKAMRKEIGIAQIIVHATKQYIEDMIKSENTDITDMVLSVLTGRKTECNCPKCRQLREQRKEWN